MNKKLDIYKCSSCGTIVAVNRGGVGKLVCCDKLMERKDINGSEASIEKHIPVLTKLSENKYKIVVGEVEHPMTEEHYIEWIDVLLKNDSRLTFFLNPNDKPKVVFTTEIEIIEVQSYCNLHGLWGKKQ